MTSLTREKVMVSFVTYSIICSYCSGAKIWRDTWGYDFASFMPGDDSGTRGAEDECWLNCLQVVPPAFSLVELLHCCALIGRELLSVEIFS